MTDDRTYLMQLERALIRRGLDDARTADVIGELSSHLNDSGERPLEAFGDPEQYAAALLTVDEPDDDAGERYEARTFRATAGDELDILAELGRDGWELTGVRDFGLHARRPDATQSRRTWRYARRTAIRREPVLAQMQAQGWTACGRWLTFHYFKRTDTDPT